MRNKPFLIVFFVVLVSLSFSWALAETLTLRDGRVFNGTYLGGTSRTIRFRTEGVIKTFRLDEVQNLAFVDNLATTYSGAPSTQYEVRSGARTDQYGNYSGSRGGSYRRAAVRDEYVIPSGTVLRVRTNESIDSDVAHVGDSFSGTLDSDIIVNNELLAERGSPVKLRIAEVEQAGKFEGRSQLVIDLVELTTQGRSYSLTTSQVEQRGSSQGKRTAIAVGGGAALGAIIGAIAGGGKGAAIGTVLGGAGGAGYEILTKGQKIKIPAETVLEFTMQRELYLRR
ncbi:MAG TPA: hypothetical protein VGL91_06845 [Acidobacteriota bacterium]|jgi:hypothetical protein